MREEPVVLEHETDRPSGGLDKGSGAGVVHHLACERDASRGNRGQAGHRAEHGRFPGPVRSQQAQDVTCCSGQADGKGEAPAPDLGIDDQDKDQQNQGSN